MNWVRTPSKPRGYTVTSRSHDIGWQSLAVGFTPARAGAVTLTLKGPWDEASKG